MSLPGVIADDVRVVVRQPDEAVSTWIEAMNQTAVHLSVITIGEIIEGMKAFRNRRNGTACEPDP